MKEQYWSDWLPSKLGVEPKMDSKRSESSTDAGSHDGVALEYIGESSSLGKRQVVQDLFDDLHLLFEAPSMTIVEALE